jgi:hypothetical protein
MGLSLTMSSGTGSKRCSLLTVRVVAHASVFSPAKKQQQILRLPIVNSSCDGAVKTGQGSDQPPAAVGRAPRILDGCGTLSAGMKWTGRVDLDAWHSGPPIGLLGLHGLLVLCRSAAQRLLWLVRSPPYNIGPEQRDGLVFLDPEPSVFGPVR